MFASRAIIDIERCGGMSVIRHVDVDRYFAALRFPGRCGKLPSFVWVLLSPPTGARLEKVVRAPRPLPFRLSNVSRPLAAWPE
jgi:hypothetical protein